MAPPRAWHLRVIATPRGPLRQLRCPVCADWLDLEPEQLDGKKPIRCRCGFTDTADLTAYEE